MTNGPIIQTLTAIKTQLDNWAGKDGGKALVAPTINHFWEYLQQKDGSYLVVVAYNGEDMRGDESTAEAVGVVDRHFIVGLRRHRGYSADPGAKTIGNTSLEGQSVGTARPMMDIVEECRDCIRTLSLPTTLMLNPPVAFKSIRAMEMPGGWIDAYIFEFSTDTMLPTLAGF